MKVLVCGSRTFDDAVTLESVLNGLLETERRVVLIEGGAKGADHLAAKWALGRRPVVLHEVPAEWDRYGKAAGRLRNAKMLDMKPALVVAFVDKPLKESVGTAHMVTIARKAGVRTVVVEVIPPSG